MGSMEWAIFILLAGILFGIAAIYDELYKIRLALTPADGKTP